MADEVKNGASWFDDARARMEGWTFPERLRFAVELAGGIVKVAERLEVSERTLTRYFASETSPQLSFLEALAAISRVRLSWLTSGEGYASPVPTDEAPEGAEVVPPPRVTLSLPANLLLELVKSASADLPPEVREAIAKTLKEGR